MNYESQDTSDLSLVAWLEARGEGIEGCRAVMHVIVNRAQAWYRSTQSIIYQPNQFTSISVPSDPEHGLTPQAGDAIYAQCVALAPQVLSGDDADPTNGALYYANLATMTSGWFKTAIVENPAQHPETAVIVHHTFFR